MIRTVHALAVSLLHPQYPQLLKEIPDPPAILYVLGTTEVLTHTYMIAVVGSRKPSTYGVAMTKRIVSGLVQHGYVVVSGMAYGIDTVAHATAIGSGGKTVAVLGCGIDIIAPSGNTQLYRQIVCGHGAVVSEIPGAIRTQKRQFVRRNRIISGMARGIVVVEGTERSGTLITASYAANQGRDVFAVPGAVTNPLSKASSILLKNGAKLVESADDILEEYT